MTNFLRYATNQLCKLRTKNCIATINYRNGVYAEDKEIKFKNSMLRSSLCDQSDAYILVK